MKCMTPTDSTRSGLSYQGRTMLAFPPRGSGVDGRQEASPSSTWLHPSQLDGPEWAYTPKGVYLGMWKGKPIGWNDDRHMVTVAGSRAGKSRTVLIPNLKTYSGPAVVIDPKGELARETAATRAKFGPVYILDPFGETKAPSAHFNPFDELRRSTPETLSADAAQMADALIVAPERGDAHWTDAAKNLIAGMLLHFVTADPERATLPGLRTALTGTAHDLRALFLAMAENNAQDGAVANIGRAYAGKIYDDGELTGELRSIISTASEQTRPLDDVARISDRSDFNLADLSRGGIGTLYLVLPAMRIGTHYRWLRLCIYQALAALERSPVSYKSLPAWFVLEEFASLGNMRVIETAAGYMAGFGVKLWVVLQDFTQLQNHYPKTWETFLGNAGVIQAFGNVDKTTTEYLSRLMGETTIAEWQQTRTTGAGMLAGDDGRREHVRHPPLLSPPEISMYFARQTGRALILAAGHSPTFVERSDNPFGS